MLMNINLNKGQSEMTFNAMLSDPTQQNLWSNVWDLILMRLQTDFNEIANLLTPSGSFYPFKLYESM